MKTKRPTQPELNLTTQSLCEVDVTPSFIGAPAMFTQKRSNMLVSRFLFLVCFLSYSLVGFSQKLDGQMELREAYTSLCEQPSDSVRQVRFFQAYPATFLELQSCFVENRFQNHVIDYVLYLTAFDQLAFISKEEKMSRLFNPNRSLDPEQISLDCWADGWLWVRRRSGLRQERTRNKMPTRKWKMAGSYLLYNELHYNGLMTDLGSIYL